jgi:hypothetical protein
MPVVVVSVQHWIPLHNRSTWILLDIAATAKPALSERIRQKNEFSKSKSERFWDLLLATTIMHCFGYHNAQLWLPQCTALATTMHCFGYHNALLWLPQCTFTATTMQCVLLGPTMHCFEQHNTMCIYSVSLISTMSLKVNVHKGVFKNKKTRDRIIHRVILYQVCTDVRRPFMAQRWTRHLEQAMTIRGLPYSLNEMWEFPVFDLLCFSEVTWSIVEGPLY